MRYFMMVVALLAAACQQSALDDIKGFGVDPVDAFDSAAVGGIMLVGGGWGANTTPVLETSTPTPGEPLQLRVSGMTPGQAVAVFVGAPNNGVACGTALQAPLSGWFGPCLQVRNGRAFPVMLTADWQGKAYHEVTVPAHLPLGRTFAFEAITPALVPLSSGQVTATTVSTALDCAWEFPGQYTTTVQGAEDHIIGRITCTATGGDLEIEELVLRQRHDFSLDFFGAVSLWAGDFPLGDEAVAPDGSIEFNSVDWLVEDGDTVTFVVTADIANFGGPWSYAFELELDSVEGADEATSDSVRWLGGPDDYVWIEVREREEMWCSLSSANPDAQLVVPSAEYAVGAWRCYGYYGDVGARDWSFELVGDASMYESFRLSDGTTSHQISSPPRRVEFNSVDFRVPRDGYLEVTLYATTAGHFLDGGDGETGDTVIPALVEVQGFGMDSGSFVEWTGWSDAEPMTFVGTTLTASLSSSSTGGWQSPGVLTALTAVLAAGPTGDALVTYLEYEVFTTGGSWRNCDTDASPTSALGAEDFSVLVDSNNVDGIWNLYGSDGYPCDTSPIDLRYVSFEPTDEVYVEAGFFEAVSLQVNASGAGQDDVLQVHLTEVCWDDGSATTCISGWEQGLPVRGPTYWFY